MVSYIKHGEQEKPFCSLVYGTQVDSIAVLNRLVNRSERVQEMETSIFLSFMVARKSTAEARARSKNAVRIKMTEALRQDR